MGEQRKVGATLKKLREQKAMGQIELATRAGLSQSYVTMLETGAKRNPTLAALQRLADALGVATADLLTEPPGPRPRTKSKVLTLARVCRLLERHPWVYARTMPKTPHWYTILKAWPDQEAFDDVVQFIRERGVTEIFRRKPYRVLVAGQWKYWTMGAALHRTILINKAKVLDTTPGDGGEAGGGGGDNGRI